MFIFNLSNKTNRLPGLNNWFNTALAGGKDGSPLIYSFPRLEEINKTLSAEKSKLDDIYNDPEYAKYVKISKEIYPYEDLRMCGRLTYEFGARICTKGWLKIHELVHRFLLPYLRAANRAPNPRLNSFHVAEAPGSFLLSINHYIKSHFPDMKWDWMAESYKIPATAGRGGYIGDTYGIMKRYPKRWLFGADGDGDITSTANIRSFQHVLKKRWNRMADFYTSDVKFVPEPPNFNNEEIDNLSAHIGHILCALLTLRKGGIAIFKMFTYFKPTSICLLYLLHCTFKQMAITKPLTSSPWNSETYVVCTGYKANLSKTQLKIITDYLDFISGGKTQSMHALFKNVVPYAFVKKIEKVSEVLAKKQIFALRKSMRSFMVYRDKPLSILRKDIHHSRNVKATKWIRMQNMKSISGDSLDLT